MNKYTCPRINLSSFSRYELGTPLLKLLNCKRKKKPQETSPQHPGVVRVHVNAFYFSTTARRVISPSWGAPPPCNQALNFAASSLRRFTGSFGHKSLIKTVKCSRFKEKIFSSKPMIWYDCEIDLCDLHIMKFMICRSHPLRYFCEEKFDLNYASVRR